MYELVSPAGSFIFSPASEVHTTNPYLSSYTRLFFFQTTWPREVIQIFSVKFAFLSSLTIWRSYATFIWSLTFHKNRINFFPRRLNYNFGKILIFYKEVAPFKSHISNMKYLILIIHNVDIMNVDVVIEYKSTDIVFVGANYLYLDMYHEVFKLWTISQPFDLGKFNKTHFPFS